MNKMARVSGYAILGCLLSVACVWLLYALIGHSLIEAMYQGRSIGFLNRIIEGQEVHSLGYYLRVADARLRTLSVGFVSATLFFVFLSSALDTVIWHRDRLWAGEQDPAGIARGPDPRAHVDRR